MALVIGVVGATSAGAEPQQGAVGHGLVRVQYVRSGDTVTWGPWTFKGAWRADDGTRFAGTVTGGQAVSAPPTPTWVITDFTVSGTSSTTSLSGTCSGSVARRVAGITRLSTYCKLYITGASLAADDSADVTLVAVKKTRTDTGYVIDYRGEF